MKVCGHGGKKGEHSRKNEIINCVKYIRISTDIIKTSLCGATLSVIDKLPQENFSKWRQKSGHSLLKT